MPRYKGTVYQSILDWYAAQAMAAQQWFSNAAPNYWAFSLSNNATDGRRLWIYDGETVSGAAFPSGTGNPAGNPNAQAGYQGSSGAAQIPVLISQTFAQANNVTSLSVPVPGAIVAGNMIVVVTVGGGFAASFMTAPDSTWTLLAHADGVSGGTSIAAFGHIATNSEPANWIFGCGNNPTSSIGAIATQFAGCVNPVAIDAAGGNVGAVASTTMVAPGLTLTTQGDLLVTAYTCRDAPSTVFTGDSSFTLVNSTVAYGNRIWVGYKVQPQSGSVGPFIGTQAPARTWGAISFTIKPSNTGAAPGQSLSAPIASVAPAQAGIFSLGFSTAPLALGGITRWIPPASHFEWHREAPLAVLQVGDQFNLAGISPENAAWGSLTWLAIK